MAAACGRSAFPAGNYYLGHLDVDQNASLTFAGDVNIVTLEDFYIDRGASLVVTGNANIASGDGLADDFDFEVDRHASVTFQGTASISAEEIEFEGTVDFQGAAVLDVLEEIEFDKHSVVNFGAGVVLDAQQELEFDGHSVVTIGAPSQWYVGEELEIDDQAVVITPSERAADLLVSVWGADSEVEIESGRGHCGDGGCGCHGRNAVFCGAIYAPYSEVEVKGDLEDCHCGSGARGGSGCTCHSGDRYNFQGAIIGNTIEIEEDVNFHYDEALGAIGTPSANTFSILVERELPAGIE